MPNGFGHESHLKFTGEIAASSSSTNKTAATQSTPLTENSIFGINISKNHLSRIQ
jgi:hypothetical protein